VSSNYLMWTNDNVKGACSLAAMQGYPQDWKLLYGETVMHEFPTTASFSLDPDLPRNVMLTDNLDNIDMLIVASHRLRDLIRSEQPSEIEYVPVQIIDHKRRLVHDPYFIVHPLHPVDCLDVDACGAEWGEILKKEIESVEQLVIDESRIPPDRLLFRPRLFCQVILVHRALASKIDAAGVTGVRWQELADYA
jgi:hypothetical protein